MNKRGSGQTPLVIAVFACIFTASAWYYLNSRGDSTEPSDSGAIPQSEINVVVESPQSATLDSSTEPLDTPAIDTGSSVTDVVQTPDEPQITDPDFDITQIAFAHLSEAEFNRLTEQLRENPARRSLLLNEFRDNTDPDRAKRLARLLGQFDDPGITEVGAELALSGNVASQQAGLYLLGKQQKQSPLARKKVVEVMAAESNPVVLVSALNALAKPAKTTDVEKQQLLDQFEHLSTNDDPLVRSHSLSLMSAWSRGSGINDVLIRGLSDEDKRVRASATFALIKTQQTTSAGKTGLLATAQNPDEAKRTREGALYALSRFDLTDAEQQQVAQLKIALEALR